MRTQTHWIALLELVGIVYMVCSTGRMLDTHHEDIPHPNVSNMSIHLRSRHFYPGPTGWVKLHGVSSVLTQQARMLTFRRGRNKYHSVPNIESCLFSIVWLRAERGPLSPSAHGDGKLFLVIRGKVWTRLLPLPSCFPHPCHPDPMSSWPSNILHK